MAKARNFLFIMCDQLRWDYLSCAGHGTLQTPNIDALAAKGVRFTQAYSQSPLCGPSRMSFYTGRYMFTHGATWNGVALPVGELTMGDYLRPHGHRVALVGKTHMIADREGMQRLEVNPVSDLGVLVSECGFEPYERDDGMWPPFLLDPNLRYNKYLNELGYPGENPWHDYANSAEGPNGEVLSGWKMRYSNLPARVAEEHSETPYMTNRAMEFIDECGDQPWCLHLSYIKPHWPYMAPAPYHNMYSVEDVQPVVREEQECQSAHPVFAAFMNQPDSQVFQRDETIQTVVPTYMGLIKQIDDHLGRLWDYLEETGRWEDTMVVFTSDHGDYLGDHWLGEKEMLHDASALIPFIVYDPDSSADETRGSADDHFIESVDVIPTFLDALEANNHDERLEGRSLLPLTRGGSAPVWREAAFSEMDYAFRSVGVELGVEPDKARCYMVRTPDWKYIWYEGFRAQLFDMNNDPSELHDLGGQASYEAVEAEHKDRLFEWLRHRKTRVTVSMDRLRDRNASIKAAGKAPSSLRGNW